MPPGDTSWRHTPVEFVDVPAGTVLPDSLISRAVQGSICPDCIPAGYRLRYRPEPVGMSPADSRAWEVTTLHGRNCPGIWLRQQRADGSR